MWNHEILNDAAQAIAICRSELSSPHFRDRLFAADEALIAAFAALHEIGIVEDEWSNRIVGDCIEIEHRREGVSWNRITPVDAIDLAELLINADVGDVAEMVNAVPTVLRIDRVLGVEEIAA